MNTHTSLQEPFALADLRAARARAGLTQEALAWTAGVSLSTLRRAERGDERITRGTLMLIRIALADAAEQVVDE